jgi:hypothetical protein
MHILEGGRRIVLRLVYGSLLLLGGCDPSRLYSEGENIPGAYWQWEARALASPSDLIALARAVLSRAPDASVSKYEEGNGEIKWLGEPGQTMYITNTWQIVFVASTEDSKHAKLLMHATYIRLNEKNVPTPSPPTPEAKRRFDALIQNVLAAGKKWQLTTIVEPHRIE